MEFTCSTDLVAQLPTKDLKALAPAIAKQLFETVEPIQIARLVLTRDEALRLLTENIRKHPKETLAALSNGQAEPAKPRAAQAQRAAKHGPRPRANAAELQASVLAFLKSHPASGRKAICEAVPFPSTNVYMRVMSQLTAGKQVKAQGDKRARVYSAR